MQKPRRTIGQGVMEPATGRERLIARPSQNSNRGGHRRAAQERRGLVHPRERGRVAAGREPPLRGVPPLGEHRLRAEPPHGAT